MIETKDKSENDLATNEQQRIKHAKFLFKELSDVFNVKFVTQLSNQKIIDLIKMSVSSEKG